VVVATVVIERAGLDALLAPIAAMLPVLVDAVLGELAFPRAGTRPLE
jgi:hypothetical protein